MDEAPKITSAEKENYSAVLAQKRITLKGYQDRTENKQPQIEARLKAEIANLEKLTK